jgi:hypothetical protein
MDRKFIETYAAGAAVPARLIRGLTLPELDQLPIPGTWSIRQIIVHLADSDLVIADRMKRVIAADRPALLAFDENAFVDRLDYVHTDPVIAAELFDLNRRVMAAILRRLPDEAFARIGIHSETGPKSLQQLVEGAAAHLERHAGFAIKKREMIGKPIE